MRLCDSCSAERGAAGERRALELARDAVLVEPVAALVHRPEEAVEVVVEVARRQPDVGGRDRGRERDGRPCRAATPTGRSRSARSPSARTPAGRSSGNGRRRGPAAPRRARAAATSGTCSCFSRSKTVAHLGRLHPRLEVVEQHVVRLVVVVEALDVAPAQVEVRGAAPAGTARSRTFWRASTQTRHRERVRRAASRRAARRARGAPSPSRGATTRIRLASSESYGATPRTARARRAAGRSRRR